MKHFSLMLVMVLFTVSTALAQRTITGTVMLDGEGEAIGANVVIDGDEGSGTVTEFDGTFSLDVPATAKALKISYTGFATQVVSIEGTSTVNVTLAPDGELLDLGVVVVGYETLKKGDVSTSLSVVSGEELTQIPVGNIENLLQGKSTGLQVTASNGKPGAGAYIRLRGTGSANASNEPLYVVDGAQVTATFMNALNPNDIESITVLKDAASTSIYGSSGSNGVIVITTKRGAVKPTARPEITFSSQFGVKRKTPDNFEMMDAQQKMDYETELFNDYGIGNGATVATYQDATVRDSLLAVSGDWQDILLRTGVFQSYNLSMGGSSEKARYFASIGYYDEEGIAKGSNFERLTARFTTDYDAADWLTLGSSLSASRTSSRELRDRYNVQNPFVAMYTYNPYESEYLLGSQDPTDILYDANGNPEYNWTHTGFSISEAIQNNPENDQDMQFNGQVYASFKLIEGLNFKTTLSGNLWQRQTEYFITPGSILDQYVGDPAAPGIASFTNTRRFNYQWNNILTYSHTLNESHNLNYLLGHELYDYDRYRSRVEGFGFPNSSLYTLDNAAEIDGGYTIRDEAAKLSFFGNVRYDYNRKYLATFTYRTDGSSSFGANNRYGHFFAGSLAWNIHMEDFAASVFNDKVDQLKIRLSAGTSGNDSGATSYTRLGTIATSSYGAQTSLVPGRPENTDLRWEKSFSTSLGLDFGFFNNKITGAVDIYRRETSDLLFNSPLDPQSGVNGQAINSNIGSFVNKGVEVEISADVVRMPEKKLNIEIFGSFSLNDNEVVSLADTDGDPTTPTELFDGVSVIKEGEEYYTYNLVRYAGVDPATGDELYYDKDGDITNVWSGDDAVPLTGISVLPKFFGAFGTNVNFHGFDLGVNFYYNVGNYTYNQAFVQDLMSNGESIADNQRADAINFWRNPGDVTDIPRPTGVNNASDRFLQKGDYIRLRNVRVGYTVPVKSKWLTGVNIFAQANNLKTWTNFDGDPEVGTGSAESDLFIPGQYALYSYPQTFGMTFGLNVNF